MLPTFLRAVDFDSAAQNLSHLTPAFATHQICRIRRTCLPLDLLCNATSSPLRRGVSGMQGRVHRRLQIGEGKREQPQHRKDFVIGLIAGRTWVLVRVVMEDLRKAGQERTPKGPREDEAANHPRHSLTGPLVL